MNTTKTSEQTTGRSYAPSITNTSRVIGEVVVVDFGTLGKMEDMDKAEDILLLLLFKIEHYSRFAYKGRTAPSSKI